MCVKFCSPIESWMNSYAEYIQWLYHAKYDLKSKTLTGTWLSFCLFICQGHPGGWALSSLNGLQLRHGPTDYLRIGQLTTSASANWLPPHRPTDYLRIGQLTTSASANWLPPHRPTDYLRIGQLTTSASANWLPPHRPIDYLRIGQLTTSASANWLPPQLGAHSVALLYTVFQVE